MCGQCLSSIFLHKYLSNGPILTQTRKRRRWTTQAMERINLPVCAQELKQTSLYEPLVVFVRSFDTRKAPCSPEPNCINFRVSGSQLMQIANQTGIRSGSNATWTFQAIISTWHPQNMQLVVPVLQFYFYPQSCEHILNKSVYSVPTNKITQSCYVYAHVDFDGWKNSHFRNRTDRSMHCSMLVNMLAWSWRMSFLRNRMEAHTHH